MALDLTAAAADVAKELREVKTDVQALRLEIARLEEREALAENREIIYEAEVDRLNQQVHTLTTIDIPMANDACLEAEGKIETLRHGRFTGLKHQFGNLIASKT